jgi:hypothetical protein
MFRFVLSILVCLFCFGCMSPQLRAQREAELKTAIEAHKIPVVRLSEAQIATLKEQAPNDQIAWYRAGRQSDGKIFVCLVTNGKNRFGDSSHTNLITGTLESDGSFSRSLAYLQDSRAVVNDCRAHGFDPPIKICQTQVLGTRCTGTAVGRPLLD